MNVHILGGGIGGMSTALHLGRLRAAGHLPGDTTLVIHERSTRLGGKASSQFGHPTLPGRWPGEHGFRFFPNFYRCVVDTLRYVPITPDHRAAAGLRDDVGPTVFDALLPSREGGMGVDGGILRIDRAPSLLELPRTVGQLLHRFGVKPRDIAVYTSVLTRFLCTCQDRALENWESKTLDDFIRENGFSDGMVDFLQSLRALSAMRANRGSLRTLLFTSVQLLADFDPEYHLWDALLPGPTDELMLQPWEQELRRLGVQVQFGHTTTALAFAPSSFGVPGRWTEARIDTPAGELVLNGSGGDVVVLAIPWEAARPLLVAAPNLPEPLQGVRHVPQRPDNLGDGSEPMVGVQFWLAVDRPMVEGHMVYPGAPWAITSVSQAQFWSRTYTAPLAATFGTPGLQGIVSAIVSAWDTPAPRLGKAPQACTAEEIARETFAQIIEHSGATMSWDQVLAWNVDRDVRFSPGSAFCPTPLWVSPAGSFLHRPLPDPGLGNFFVASDWARTDTDVGSMESADEAARWVVRALARTFADPPAESELPVVRPIRLWPALEAARAVDQWLFDHGVDSLTDLSPAARLAMTALFRKVQGGADPASVAEAWAGLTRTDPALPPPTSGPLLGRVVDLFERLTRARWNDDGDVPGLSEALDEP